MRNEHDRIVHPLQGRPNEFLHRLLDELKNAGYFPDCDDAALADFVGHCMNLTAKLAGALGSVARGWEPDAGMTIARLKRILTILNESLTASDRVPAKYLSSDRLLRFRSDLFALREEILALVARLRGGD